MSFEYRAYAKVNVGLKVGAKREDGYHPLTTYFHLISLHDELSFDIYPSSDVRVEIEGNSLYTQSGEIDLMEKAALIYAKNRGKSFCLKIKIKKNIPFGAGLGGGSSDAASVLIFLSDYFKDEESLQEMALTLGSDVPFFTSRYCAAKGEGRGEILTPITPVSAKAVLLMPNAKKISTKWAFSQLAKRNNPLLLLPKWNENWKKWYEIYENDFLEVQDSSECTLNRSKFGLILSGSGACFYSMLDLSEKFYEIKDTFKDTKIIPVEFLKSV